MKRLIFLVLIWLLALSSLGMAVMDIMKEDFGLIGNVKTVKTIYGSSGKEMIFESRFSEKGLIVEGLFHMTGHPPSRAGYDDKQRVAEVLGEGSLHYYYDEKNKTYEAKDSRGQIREFGELDETGRIRLMIQLHKGEVRWRCRYTYNEVGQIVLFEELNSKGEVKIERIFTHNLLRYRTQMISRSFLETEKLGKKYILNNYQYNEQGWPQSIESTIESEDGTKKVLRVENYRYEEIDSKGNWGKQIRSESGKQDNIIRREITYYE